MSRRDKRKRDQDEDEVMVFEGVDLEEGVGEGVASESW
jgi:hypothetical protein